MPARFWVISCFAHFLADAVEYDDLPTWLWGTEKDIRNKKEALIFGGPTVTLTEENFEAVLNDVGRGRPPILVGFFSPRCRYSKRVKPTFDSLANTYNSSVLRFAGVDDRAYGDVKDKIEERFSIRLPVIPSFLILRAAGPPVKYFGPRTPDDFEVWVGMYTGAGAPYVPFAWRMVLLVYHHAVAGLAALLELLGIEPRDNGDAWPFFDDGGTIGTAAIVIGAVLGVMFAMVILLRLRPWAVKAA